MLPGCLDNVASRLITVITQGSDELLVADLAILVHVKVIEDSSELLCGEENTESIEECVKFLLVKLTVTILIVLEEFA